MSLPLPYRQLLTPDAALEDHSTLVPFSKTIVGQLHLLRHFVTLEQRHLPQSQAPTITEVASFLERVDVDTFPYNVTEECPTSADRLKTLMSNVDSLWETLLLTATPASASAPAGSQAADTTQPFSPEKRALAATLETQRIRLAAHSAENAKTGIPFFNENLELQTQRLLVQSTTVVEAAVRTLAARLGSSPLDAEGNPRTLEQILDLIPPGLGESADATKGLAESVRELRRLAKYLYDSVKLATRVPGINGYFVLQELEHRDRLDREELICDPEYTFKTSFPEQAEAAAKRLKDNVPGSICPALALVNKPVADPQPPRTPAGEDGAPRGRDAGRPGRAAPHGRKEIPPRNRAPRQDQDEDYEDRPYERKNRSNDYDKGAYRGEGAYRGGWPRDRPYRR